MNTTIIDLATQLALVAQEYNNLVQEIQLLEKEKDSWVEQFQKQKEEKEHLEKIIETLESNQIKEGK